MRGLISSVIAAILGLVLATSESRSEIPSEVAHGALEEAGQGVPRLEVEHELMTPLNPFVQFPGERSVLQTPPPRRN